MAIDAHGLGDEEVGVRVTAVSHPVCQSRNVGGLLGGSRYVRGMQECLGSTLWSLSVRTKKDQDTTALVGRVHTSIT